LRVSFGVFSVKGNVNIGVAVLWYGLCDGMTGVNSFECQPDDRSGGPVQDDNQQWNVNK
jgi:hypothetical protein